MARWPVFKAEMLNSLVHEWGIESIVEFGCGDGNQLALATYPHDVGLDVSRTAIRLCTTRFSTDQSKSFFLYDPTCFVDHAQVFDAQAALSVDVIFHLDVDEVYETYMRRLFAAATRFIVIYSSDIDVRSSSPHERHRNFTSWVARNMTDWRLARQIPNRYPAGGSALESASDFYIYSRDAISGT